MGWACAHGHTVTVPGPSASTEVTFTVTAPAPPPPTRTCRRARDHGGRLAGVDQARGAPAARSRAGRRSRRRRPRRRGRRWPRWCGCTPCPGPSPEVPRPTSAELDTVWPATKFTVDVVGTSPPHGKAARKPADVGFDDGERQERRARRRWPRRRGPATVRGWISPPAWRCSQKRPRLSARRLGASGTSPPGSPITTGVAGGWGVAGTDGVRRRGRCRRLTAAHDRAGDRADRRGASRPVRAGGRRGGGRRRRASGRPW